MVVTPTHTKDQGQRSVGLKDRVETDRWTDERTEVIALTPVQTWLVTTIIIIKWIFVQCKKVTTCEMVLFMLRCCRNIKSN